VKVIGINPSEDLSTIQNFATMFGLTYPVLQDPGGFIYNQYRIPSISPYPLDVIIDQGGIIRYIHTEYDPQYMLEIINNLLSSTGLEPGLKTTEIPIDLELKAFPNPTNSRTIITVRIAAREETTLELYDISGRLLRRENFGRHNIGDLLTYSLDMNNYASGIFFVYVKNGKYNKTAKLILIR
jgi:hypothetical protein